MPIIFRCSGGHSLSVDPSAAGKRVRCPVCQEILMAPIDAPPAASQPIPPPNDAVQPSSIAPPSPQAPAPLPNPSPIPRMELEIVAKSPEPPPPPFALPSEGIIPLAGADPPSGLSVPVAVSATAVAGAELKTSEPDGSAYGVADEVPRPGGDYLAYLGNLLHRKGRRQQLETVKLGLAFHYWKYLTFIVSVLLLWSGILLVTLPFPKWIGGAAVVLGCLGYFAAPVLGMTGSVFCIQAPEKTRARPVIFAALVLDAVGLMFTLVSCCLFFIPPVLFIVGSLAYMFILASFVLFMLFVRAMTGFFDDPGAADEAASVTVWLVAIPLGGFVALAFGAFFFHWLLGGQSAEVVAFLVILICVGLYLNLMFRILALISTLRSRM
jgi:hypothetical protein